MTAPAVLIGLMSGTSLDGVDGVLVRFTGEALRVEAHAHRPFDARLREDLLQLQAEGPAELARAALAAERLARLYHLCVQDLLGQMRMVAAEVRAIAAHGQTVRHRPDRGYTVQINHPALLAELTGIDVICDFRSRDVAAGGHGAPLVPAFHATGFADAREQRVVLNLGGMANVTVLPPRSAAEAAVRGWDTGPGNVLLDGWYARQHPHAPDAFDRDGQYAASGRADEDLLQRLLAEPWLALPPPKSTGRDTFHLDWVLRQLAGHEDPADVQATLAELTAQSIAASIAAHGGEPDRVIVCGGGVHNLDLLERLAARLHKALGRPVPVESCARFGLAADHVEATAFAWLGERFLRRQPGNLAAVTGARGPRILGALYPA